MAATYPVDVPSIRHKHQALPLLGDIDRYLDDSITAGDPVHSADVSNAKHAAGVLRHKYYMREVAQLTEAVVETAELRATAIETYQAELTFPLRGPPPQIANVLEAINALGAVVRLARAETANNSIRLQNWLSTPRQYRAVQKTVEGSGLVVAQELATTHPIRAQITEYAADHPPTPVGTTPVFYNADLDNMGQLHILKLILFYNETMGIEAGHDLAERKTAIAEFFQRI